MGGESMGGDGLSGDEPLSDEGSRVAGRGPLLMAGVAQARGGRPYMEDRHGIIHDMGTLHPRLGGVHFLLVLDGHGGSRCAEFVQSELHKRLGVLAAAGELGFGSSSLQVEAAFTRTFESIDADFLTQARAQRYGDGTTVLCALVRGSTLDVANVGDSRAVLGRRPDRQPAEVQRAMRERDCAAVRLSVDHKPDLPDETSRVQSRGGIVRNVSGCWRVVSPNAQTMLAVSRAIGDRDLKDSTTLPLISSTPFVVSHALTPRDQFVILASDGIWDVMEDATAVKLVAEVLKRPIPQSAGQSGAAAAKLQAQAAAETLVRRAAQLGSLDNTTALVGYFVWE